MEHFDITIIGDRMAAAAALIGLQQYMSATKPLKVAVVAPTRVKAEQPLVGESLPPTIQPLMEQMGLWQGFLGLNYPCSEVRFSCWENLQLQPVFARHSAYGFGWCVDRAGFEQYLWQKAKQMTFTTITTTFKSSVKTGAGWLLTLVNDQTITSDFVLDCTGRAASFAKTQTERKKGSQMVAVCDFLTPLNQQVQRSAGVMIEAVEDGWWYSSLLPNGQLAIAYFTLREAVDSQLCRDQRRWQQLLDCSEYTRLRVETGEFATFNRPKLFDASMSCLEQTCGDDWLACGDAAMSLDPLSSHGMSMALWSGYKGAEAAVSALNGDRQLLLQYADSCQQNWQLYCQQRQSIYQQQGRFEDSVFWSGVKILG